MKIATNLNLRCCCIFACLFASLYVLVCLPLHAQTLPPVASEWEIGNQTVKLPDIFRKDVESRVEQIIQNDLPHIRQNIQSIMLLLEWVRNHFENSKDSIPKEYCYLVLYEHQLIKKAHNGSNITRKADNIFWGLTLSKLDRLGLQDKLDDTPYFDDKRNLYHTTNLISKEFKRAQNNFQNWALSMLIIDLGYEGLKEEIKNS